MATTLAKDEAYVLSVWLLERANLTDIISPKDFAALFPKAQRSHPQVKSLYRELQDRQEARCETVRKNIKVEVKLGRKQRTVYQREAERVRKEEEMDVDEHDVGEIYGQKRRKPLRRLPIGNMLALLEKVNKDLESDFRDLDKECDGLLKDMNTIVGDLSDLRYGKLEKEGIVQDVIADAERLQGVCEDALAE